MGKEQPCRHKGQWKKRERRCPRPWSWDPSAAHAGDRGEAAAALQAVEVRGDAKIHPKLMEEEPTMERLDAWRRLWAHRREGSAPLMEQPVLERLHPMEKRSTSQQFVESCSSSDGFMLKKLMKNCLPWEGPNGAAGEWLVSLSRRRNHRWWTEHNPNPCTTGGGESWEGGRGGGRVFFKRLFYFLSWCHYVIDKFNSYL